MSQPTGVLRVASHLAQEEEGGAGSLVTEIVTRGYELDQEGLIPPHVLLRYMEHLRWRAPRDGDSSLLRLFEEGNHAVLVAEKLVIPGQLSFDVTLRGTTRVARVGRSSLDFFHDLFLEGDGSRVAAGLVTAVHVGPDARPIPLPSALRDLAVTPPPEEVTFPEPLATAPPDDAWRYPIRIRPSDQDLLRHANHARHLALVDDARREAAAAGALGEHSPRAGQRIHAAAIDFKQQTVAGDALEAAVWVVTPEPLTLGVVMMRAGDGGVITRAKLQL